MFVTPLSPLLLGGKGDEGKRGSVRVENRPTYVVR